MAGYETYGNNAGGRRAGLRAALIITGYAFVLATADVDLANYEVLLKPISREKSC
jgi:hypothetical protein